MKRLLASLGLPERVGWRDHWVGASLALLYATAILATARSVGFGRDESVYFRAGSAYFRWWLSLFEHGSNALSPRS